MQANPELRDALSDPARSRDDKATLISGLLGDKVASRRPSPSSQQSLSGSLPHGHGRARRATRRWPPRSAGRAWRRCASRSRSPDAERARGWPRRSRGTYGREIHLNVIVDPDVIGGIRVEIGDDVIDGTVSTRLDEAGRKLAG